MKCIAIFLVTTYHAFWLEHDFVLDPSFVSYSRYLFKTVLSACVPLFFFINGYLLFGRPLDMSKHIKRTVKYVLIVLFWAPVLLLLFFAVSPEEHTVSEFFKALVDLDHDWSIRHFWYLGALVCIYIFFPALKALFDTNIKAFILFVAVCGFFTFGIPLLSQLSEFISILTGAKTVSLDKEIVEMFDPFRGIYGFSFVYFCVGGLVNRYEDRILSVPVRKRNFYACFGLIAGCLWLFTIGVYKSNYILSDIWNPVWNGYETVPTFCITMSIYILCLNFKKDSRVVNTAAKNTLGIYILNYVLIRISKETVMSWRFMDNIPAHLVFSALLIICYLGMVFVLKKIPLIKNLI